MMILILIAILVGAMLGLRFKAFVLVPVICVATFMVAIGGGARGDDLWHLAGLTIGITTALQLGYFSGSVARLVMERPGLGSTTEIEEEETLISGGTAGWWSESLGRFDHTESPHKHGKPQAPWGGPGCHSSADFTERDCVFLAETRLCGSTIAVASASMISGRRASFLQQTAGAQRARGTIRSCP